MSLQGSLKRASVDGAEEQEKKSEDSIALMNL